MTLKDKYKSFIHDLIVSVELDLYSNAENTTHIDTKGFITHFFDDERVLIDLDNNTITLSSETNGFGENKQREEYFKFADSASTHILNKVKELALNESFNLFLTHESFLCQSIQMVRLLDGNNIFEVLLTHKENMGDSDDDKRFVQINAILKVNKDVIENREAIPTKVFNKMLKKAIDGNTSSELIKIRYRKSA